ncbi:MAG: ATP-binding protein [Chloroflexi bacterium]|nr:ATP-binding protein [Chloroflexota bacterium]
MTALSGKILEANRRAFAFLGYAEADLLNKNIAELHPPEITLPPIKRMGNNSIRVFNSQLIAQNGRRIHVEVYAKRTTYGVDEFIQWIFHDISQQIELEEMRKDLQAMLFHDLQSPLGNVISSLELLTYEIPDDSSPAMLEMLDIAIRSSGRLQTLIRSLLDINQMEAGHPITEQNQTNFNLLVRDVWDTIKPSYEKRNIKLVQDVPSDLPDVFVEEDMIRRVLVNLLDNAVKYSPDSQEITLAATVCKDNMVLVSVSDQGEGIPEALRKIVFEKFRRIKNRYLFQRVGPRPGLLPVNGGGARRPDLGG